MFMRVGPSWMGLMPRPKQLQRAASPFHHVRTREKSAVCKLEENPYKNPTGLVY